MGVKQSTRQIVKNHVSNILGMFQVALSSEGAETEEAFNASLIKNEKTVFRPGMVLKDMLLTLRFEKTR